MSLKARVTEDMKNAMRAKEAARLSTLRLLLAAMKQREVDERIELSDADVLAIVEKEIKKRRDSIAQFQQAGRTELAESEAREVEVLSAYLPAQLSEAEVAAEVDRVIAETGAQGPKDMGKVMGVLKGSLAGRTDMGRLSGIVKARLAG